VARKRNVGTLDYSDDHPTGPSRPNPFDGPSEVDLDKKPKNIGPVSISDNVIKIERSDGSVTIDLDADDAESDANTYRAGLTGFYRNLADEMDELDLQGIVNDTIEGIDADIASRKEWMDIRSKGIRMLALKIEEPQQGADFGPTAAPLEGQSRVRHSLLLEATIAFQAGARGELLPAGGPCKIKNIGPAAPPTNAPDSSQPLDELATALEQDFNWYLTDTATEYVPDTDRMFFHVAFGGDGFKKIFHCPLRRRPVSESVEAEDLIVSNAATDLYNCGRITHRIKMRRSTLRRMQLTGAYRDIDLAQLPDDEKLTEVDREKEQISGQKTTQQRPKDKDYELYECYTELDIPKFAPKYLRDEGLPLPYVLTIDLTTRECLSLRRNWRKSDRQCNIKKCFVQYPFLRGIGFYGLGFIHLLGNAVMALTAAYRLMLDAGMMANFPGMLADKQAARQLTNQFRVPPGGMVHLEVPAGKKIQDIVMAMPFKEVGPSFPAFIQHLEERTKQVAMVSNAAVGEGKQDAPVGTTLALLEQATKIESSAFKRLHDAQALEFKIIKEFFREDPEAMWRHAQGSNPSGWQWQKQQFVEALEKYELIPVADPNNPTALHRLMKAMTLKMLAMQNPPAYNMIAVDKRIMAMANIDSNGIFNPPQPQGGPDPIMGILQMRMKLEQAKLDTKQQELQLKAAIAIQQEQGKAADRASKERIEHMKAELAAAQERESQIGERLKMNAEMLQNLHQGYMDHTKMGHERHMSEREHGHNVQMDHMQHAHQQQMDERSAQREDQMASHQQQMNERQANSQDQMNAHQRGQDMFNADHTMRDWAQKAGMEAFNAGEKQKQQKFDNRLRQSEQDNAQQQPQSKPKKRGGRSRNA
jgi:hypothetical protein